MHSSINGADTPSTKPALWQHDAMANAVTDKSGINLPHWRREWIS
jgi:hypothetical protein